MRNLKQLRESYARALRSDFQLVVWFLQWRKYSMRLAEIQPIKPMKPLTPAQARLRSLRANIDNGRKQLQTERDRQRQQRERDSARKL
jgi:hypothetical protein